MLGFTAWLMIIYVVLFASAVFAFIKKKKVIGIILSAVMITGVLILGYMLITSPM